MAGVRVIVTLNFPSPEAAEQAVAGMAQAFKPVLQEPGALQYELFRSVDNPQRVVLMEETVEVAYLRLLLSPRLLHEEADLVKEATDCRLRPTCFKPPTWSGLRSGPRSMGNRSS